VFFICKKSARDTDRRLCKSATKKKIDKMFAMGNTDKDHNLADAPNELSSQTVSTVVNKRTKNRFEPEKLDFEDVSH
jgi:plasmid replication initiation protein